MKLTTIKSVLAIGFILSGACGLIYQIVWFKFLAISLGSTAHAQIIVLSTFLGGLALGNHFLGRIADKTANPVRLYAVLELLIGGYCLVYPWMYSVLGEAFRSYVISANVYGRVLPFTMLRFVLSALQLILPTVAMGGTLPALSRFFVQEPASSHTDTGVLYFLNSFGAVGGVIFAGFILIDAFGLRTTIVAAAILNLLVGIVVFFIARGPAWSELLRPPEVHEPHHRIEVHRMGVVAKAAIGVAGISGFAALLYEMLWVRMLVNLIGPSTYSFSLMLMAFIAGITGGSLLVSRPVFARVDRGVLLAVCQGGIALGTMAVLPLYDTLPYILWKIASFFNVSQASFGLFLAIECGICFTLMVIPTVFMGMSLPLAVGIVHGGGRKVGASVGMVFSVNTAGTVLGVVITGAILIPLLGIQRSFEAGIALNLLAAAVMVVCLPRWQVWAKGAALAVLLAGSVLYPMLVPRWDSNVVSSGVYRRLATLPPATYADFRSLLQTRKILFFQEGINANVAVLEYQDESRQRVLVINGKPDASTGLDMPTQVLVAQIPLFLHHDPHSVFVVGFGSGVTIGAALTHPVDSVTCLEITREVPRTASLFAPVNNNCLADPRLHVIIDDAHSYLSLVPRRYDVIISEPSNPWIAGIGNLFSKEYFELCRSRLAPGGIMAQWFHTYEVDDDIVRLVLNTFQSAFSHCQVWTPSNGDLILIGADHEIVPDFSRMASLFSVDRIRASFDRVSVRTLFTLLSTQALSPEGVYALTEHAPLNTEDRPLLEFSAPRSFFHVVSAGLIEGVDGRVNRIDTTLAAAVYCARRTPSREEVLDAMRFYFYPGNFPRMTYGLSRYAAARWGEDFMTKLYHVKACESLRFNPSGSRDLEALYLLHPDSTFLVNEFSNALWKDIQYSRTFLCSVPLAPLADALSATAGRDSVARAGLAAKLAELYYQNGELDRADSVCTLLLSALEKSPGLSQTVSVPRLMCTAANVKLLRGQYKAAERLFVSVPRDREGDALLRELGRRIEWHLLHGAAER